MTLYELNQQIGQAVRTAFDNAVWVCAEISEVREHSSGHCYLELVEKDGDFVRAKARASIWASTYRLLKPYFEQQTAQPLSAGMKILVSATVDFHEVYGLSLSIRDIDPSYSIGDIALRRLQIANQLREDGVFDMNRSLQMPLVPQRIAVISSPTAAGYGDFINQLESRGFCFYHKLFPAAMQGAQTEESVIAALEKIYDYADLFDVVVIIRGGGASADLSAFDSYPLASHCAQFPLPIIAGIGHQRDETIIDLIAHTSVKTPTAAAEMLIDLLTETADFLDNAQTSILQITKEILRMEKEMLRSSSKKISQIGKVILLQKQNDINLLIFRTKNAIPQIFLRKKQEISIFEKSLFLNSPDYVLQKGYSVTTCNGRVVLNADELKKGVRIETRFAKGKVQSEII
ncbi:MAG: exodeoxyribonuclease VII large subunit [Prevotellaceae bacterium]|jgi:exodeoxyribonuclease VII large subunit|nr:exodeoxyribonuclease VII large subunit [Prevotellaceae bacterium]